MTLTDTGPLVALIDENDPHNARAVTIAAKIQSWPLVTAEACLTEALYLVGRSAGWRGQAALWRFVDDKSLVILASSPGDPQKARGYMERFRDQPCDYADATLLVAAEAT